jgi:GDP-L-fucose synthase
MSDERRAPAAIAKDAPIFVAGHRGMVGSAIVRRLAAKSYTNILTRGRAELDLRDPRAVDAFLEFLYDNLMMEANLVHGAHKIGVERLMFLGSSCIYPREAPQPLKEEYLLTGPLEWTNEPYAIAKIAGVKLCENYNIQYGRHYFSGMPTNTYGPGDNYHPEYSHVMAALILKAHKAKVAGAEEMVVWGSGTPMREFIYVDDLADGCVFLMESGYDGGLINIGSGTDVTIRQLAETVARVVGFTGRLTFDAGKPDGTPRKLMDSGKLAALGWKAPTSLADGVARAYAAAPFHGQS